MVKPKGEGGIIAEHSEETRRTILLRYDNCYIIRCEQKYADIDKWWVHSSITLPLEG